MLSTNGRLAGPAAECANYFTQQASNLKAMQDFMAKQNYTAAQKASITGYMPVLK